MKIDPRSDKIALHYTGSEAGEPAISGVPARDLTHNDLARLVSVDHPTARGAARQSALDSLVDRLAEGPYRRTPAPSTSRGSKAAKKTTKPAAVAAPAAPAPEAPAEPSAETPKEG